MSMESLSPDESRALQDLMDGLRVIYGDRLQRAILYGQKMRGPKSSDLDVLIVIREMNNRNEELGRVHRVTEPITIERDILITVIPVDEAELEKRVETAFFSNILNRGIPLG
jgi:hypothetical protein